MKTILGLPTYVVKLIENMLPSATGHLALKVF